MSELRPTLLSRITKAVVLWLYRWKGWRLSGERKFPRKFVITGAPHTSNWDFIFFVGAVHELGIKPSFMGKVSLFRGPLKRFMYDMGGLPVTGQNATTIMLRKPLPTLIAPMTWRWSSRQKVAVAAMETGAPASITLPCAPGCRSCRPGSTMRT